MGKNWISLFWLTMLSLILFFAGIQGSPLNCFAALFPSLAQKWIGSVVFLNIREFILVPRIIFKLTNFIHGWSILKESKFKTKEKGQVQRDHVPSNVYRNHQWAMTEELDLLLSKSIISSSWIWYFPFADAQVHALHWLRLFPGSIRSLNRRPFIFKEIFIWHRSIQTSNWSADAW